MKERPILFNGTMIRALLEGRKTVTRRAVKHQPGVPVTDAIPRRDYPHGPATVNWYWRPKHGHLNRVPSNGWEFKCPFGQPGDRLWVRESWQDVHPVQVADGRYSQAGQAGIPGPPGVTYRTIYRADGPYPVVYHSHAHPYRCLQPDPEHGSNWAAENGYTGWTPSIHMPRWASRMLLEITDVRVERLQAITPDQAVAEGVDGEICRQHLETSPVRHLCREAEILGFAGLWNSTGGDWDANPWVWVVEFKRVTL
ncbi:hypothetical protein LU692_02640 [Pseudomonas sp. NMI795_08]|nr:MULTISPECIES: hypothetical protein [Pseudomonas]MCE1114156.1 hypothetical protein [Pseudomonas sp. NMI795_08]